MSDKVLLDLLATFHSARVLVFGDVMLDRFIYGSVERISPEAPIPVMSVERTLDMLGGAANVARNVATLGGSALLVGVVGEDAAAEALRAQLAAIPTIQAGLICDASRPTTCKTRHVADRQQILRSDVESKAPLNDAVAQQVLAQYRSMLAAADAIIVSDYAKGVLTDAVTAAAINAARAAGKSVLVDPKSRSFAKYRGASVLTPNRHELEVACGHECSSDEQVVAGARALLGPAQCDVMVVTRGKAGMSIVRRDGNAEHIRTVAKEVYDVSGAGDTVVATMGLSLAHGADIAHAAQLANAAAGVVVGKYGTASVTAGEVIARLGLAEEGQLSSKHFSLDSVQQLVTRWREMGLRIAFTNGCFDLLHPGHVSLLNQAKKSADRLVVGLNSDLSVRRLKGPERPVQGEVARATVLASLKAVDAVVIFGEDTPLELIDALAPDVLVKGADYTVETVVGAELVQRRGGKVLLAELLPAHSTSNTIARMSAARKA
jgi:D-beta-D-heptose 7-phosphate kinase/D-beta-D-heptose 1-phosphate adenosyltransferase